jgi:hypothetical protein
MLVSANQTTLCHSPEECSMHIHHNVNLIFQKVDVRGKKAAVWSVEPLQTLHCQRYNYGLGTGVMG